MAYLQDRPTQTLYHYTSEAGFFGIITARNLWFSDLASANDPRELNIGYERFLEAIEIVRRKDFPGSSGDFLKLLEADIGHHRELSHAFCCCFSLARDELPMWGAYGSNYSGICVGFRPAAFLATPGRMQKVKYIGTQTIDDLCAVIRDAAVTLAPYPNSIFHRIAAASEVIGAVTALKHKSWAYECEFRTGLHPVWMTPT